MLWQQKQHFQTVYIKLNVFVFKNEICKYVNMQAEKEISFIFTDSQTCTTGG